MKAYPVIVALMCSGALTACGGGSGGAGGSAASALNYTPQYSDGPTDTNLASATGGVTGVMSQADIGLSSSSSRLRSVEIRLSADGDTLFFTVDGVTQALPVETKVVGGGQFGVPGTNLVQFTASNATVDLMTYSGTGGSGSFAGFGRVGIETPVANLPSGPTPYSGLWGGQVYGKTSILNFGVASGSLDLTIDFDAGTVVGSFDGSVNAGGTGGSIVTAITGSIDGSTLDNGIAGTMLFETGYTGSAELAGKTFGWGAEDIAGGIAGDISGPAGSYSLSGTFGVD